MRAAAAALLRSYQAASPFLTRSSSRHGGRKTAVGAEPRHRQDQTCLLFVLFVAKSSVKVIGGIIFQFSRNEPMSVDI